jgi:ribonuclease BN (tRNA processing enzyme)
MHVRFRGVRGSVAWAVPDAAAHGCNTPCVEIVNGDAMLVLDAGSGIAGVRPRPGMRVSLLLSHYHWDHVLGLPYFAPFYDPGCALSVHAPSLPSYASAWLDTIFGAPFHPLAYAELSNHPAPSIVEPGAAAIGGFAVTAVPLNHPGGALAYRIAGRDGDLVYATDHEFGDPAYDEPFAALARGAAALVIDAHFTPEELPAYRGWGHSDWRQCAGFAAARDIGALYLFHHKPGRSDAELDAIQTAARRIFANTWTAREGGEFEV